MIPPHRLASVLATAFRHPSLRYAGAITLVSRVFCFGIALLAPYFIIHAPGSPGLPSEATPTAFWIRWDVGWYTAIAESGYSLKPGEGSTVSFFPLLPLLLRPLLAAGVPSWLAGLVVANLAGFVAAWMLHRWLLRELPDAAAADLATGIVVFSPQLVWHCMGLTESLFLMNTVGLLAASRTGRPWRCLAWGVAAGLTRPNALALMAPLAFLWWRPFRAALRNGDRRGSIVALAAVAGPAVGHLSYLAFLWGRFGNPAVFAQSGLIGWGLQMRPSWHLLGETLPGVGLHLFRSVDVTDAWVRLSWLIALGLSAWACIYLWERRVHGWVAVCVLAFWPLFLLSAQWGGPVISLGRYAAGLWPVAIPLTLWARERAWAAPCLLAFQGGLAALATALTFSGYPYF